MQYVQLENDRVPALGFGTWQIEGEQCVDAVRDALQLGYRHLDTAEMYGNEAEVGRAMDDSGVPREEIFLTTKVWWENLSYDDCLRAADASLERLRTDHADLLLIHWPNPRLPLGEPLRAMRALQDGGRITHLGVSNFTPALLEKALAEAPVVCNQVEYHPFLGQTELLESVRRHGMMLTAYCPLAQGEITDEPVLREIGERYGKSPAQVTLRWLIQQERVSAIPKSASAEHRRENLDIFDFELSSEEMDRISGLERGQRLVDPGFAPEWGS